MVSEICRNLAVDMAAKGGFKPDMVDELIGEMELIKRQLRETHGRPPTPDDLIRYIDNQTAIRKLEAANRRRQIKLQAEASVRLRENLRLARKDKNAKSGLRVGEIINSSVFGSQGTTWGVRRGIYQRDQALQRRRFEAESNAILESQGRIEEKMLKAEDRKALLRAAEDEYLHLQLGDEGRPGTTGDQDAQILAKHYYEMNKEYMDHAYEVGMEMGELADHGGRQTHSADKIGDMGREAWEELADSVADWERIFGVAPDEGAKKAFLTTMYNNIVYREVPELIPSRLPNSKIHPHSRVFHIKQGKPEDIGLYRRQYREQAGIGNWMDSIRADSRYLSTQIATMEVFGPNQQKGMDALLKAGQEEIYESADPLLRGDKYWQKLEKKGGRDAVNRQLSRDRDQAIQALAHGEGFRTVDQALKFLSGKTSGTDAAKAIRAFQAFRSWQSMSKLGGSPINSLFGDPATAAGTLVNVGGGLQDFARYFKTAISFASRSPEDKMRIASWGRMYEMQAATMERHSGEVIKEGTWDQKGLSLFMRGIGLDQMTRNWQGSSSIALQDFTSRLVDANQKIADMKPTTQNMFRRHAFNDVDIDAMREAMDVWGDGDPFLDSGNFDRISDEAIERTVKSDIDAINPKLSDAAKKAEYNRIIKRGRRDLISKFDSMIIDDTNHMTLVPQDQTLDIMRLGASPGSLQGEILTTAGQFLSFPVEYYDKILKRSYRGGGGGWKGTAYLANQMVLSLMAGTAILMTKEAAKGRDPMREVDFTDPAFLVKALDKGGFFTIYGNLITQQFGPFGGAHLEDMAGPGIGVPFEVWEIVEGLVGGKPEKASRDAIQFVKGNTPFGNHWAFDWLMGGVVVDALKEKADPGYLERRLDQFGY